MLAVSRLIRGPAIVGGVTLVLFFGAFGGWAVLAPLSSGAIATGVVGPDSNLRIVQHLEGGIIQAVHVREGQQVQKGDLLVSLENTQAEASFASHREEWLRLLVVRARLDAHERGLSAMVIPAPLAQSDSPELAAFSANQQRLFAIRNTTLQQQEDIYARQIDQLDSEVTALKADAISLGEQLRLSAGELVDKQGLLDQQLISRGDISVLQREQAQLRSALAANAADVARALQRVEEIKLTRLQSREAFREQVAQESTEVNNRIAQIDEAMVTTSDVLNRTGIVSPVDGTVLNISSQTPGGVVRPGEPIMSIVPADDDLYVFAHVLPRDIDVVTVGLKAHLTLMPFASRGSTPLNGEVVQVAGDATRDEVTGQSFYIARVRVPAGELARHPGMYMTPGMPADVTVVTGERTMWEYLADPLLRAVRTAFIAD